jgi:hypothetical protein
MGQDEPSAATRHPTPTFRRSPLRTLALVRAVPLVLAILVLGIAALVTGHDKSGLPFIILAGLTCVLNLAARLRRRRKEPPA